jgi:hypothetical protein
LQALGFNDDEAEKAAGDHLARITRIAVAQGKGGGMGANNPGARGVGDMAADPAAQAREEKAQSRDTTLSPDATPPVRGPGKNNAGD